MNTVYHILRYIKQVLGKGILYAKLGHFGIELYTCRLGRST
jgi:hypothetical protein